MTAKNFMKSKTLSELLKSHNVKIAYIFGSQKENGIAFLNDRNSTIDERADLDIGVVFEKLPQDIFEVYG